MEDRTSPASDAALAHDALEAENSDAEMMESEDPSLSSMRGKKRINSVSEGFDGFDAHTRRPSTKLSYAESNHEQFEDADDEAGEFDDGSTDQVSHHPFMSRTWLTDFSDQPRQPHDFVFQG